MDLFRTSENIGLLDVNFSPERHATENIAIRWRRNVWQSRHRTRTKKEDLVNSIQLPQILRTSCYQHSLLAEGTGRLMTFSYILQVYNGVVAQYVSIEGWTH